MTTRVLRIIGRMNVGGPAQQITGLMSHLDTQEFDHRLAIGRPDVGEEDWISLRAPWLADDPRVVTVPSMSRTVRPLSDLRAHQELQRIIAAFEPAIVHTHTAKAGMIGRWRAGRHPDIRFVHTFHGHAFDYLGRAQSLVLRQIERNLADQTDVLLSVGARVRDELLSLGIGQPEQYEVVPPGVVPPAMHDRDAARVELGLDLDAPVVAFVARITRQKRPDRLIEVAEAVTRHIPEAVFLVAGGATEAELAPLKAKIRHANVQFRNWVADVGQVYAACDTVLLTSDAEGMPVSLIEASMCERACVAPDVGSVREVILDGQTGRVTSTDVEDLAQAVIDLLEDRDRRNSMGSAAKLHADANFSMQRLVATTATIYDRLR